MKERVLLRTPVWTAVQMMWCITLLARLTTPPASAWSVALTALTLYVIGANVYNVTAVTTTHLEVRSVLRGWRRAEWKDVLVIERRSLLVPHAVLRDGKKLPLYGVRWRGRGARRGEPDLTTAQGLAAWARRCVGARYLTTG